MDSILSVLFLCLSLLTAKASADTLMFDISTDCQSNTNYTRGGSAFQANLDALLSSLPAAAAASTGFATNTTGAAPNQAIGLAQCRADVNASACLLCLRNSTSRMASNCPGQKSAMLIYEGCQLWYSNASFLGSSDTYDPIYKMPSHLTVTKQPEQFQSQLGELMSNLKQKAAHGSPRMFAAAAVNHTVYMTLYGAAQCRRDITANDCDECLSIAIKTIPRCCNGVEGARVYGRTCSIRFETYPFYDPQGAEVAMAMSPAPPPEHGPVNDNNNFSGDPRLSLSFT
ncbi:unnamed protein product [Urochloa humidicola]